MTDEEFMDGFVSFVVWAIDNPIVFSIPVVFVVLALWGLGKLYRALAAAERSLYS